METVTNEFLNTKKGKDFVRNLGNYLANHPSKTAYGFVGVFGTKELGHDIDLLFYPSGNKPIGEYIITHLNFLKEIKEKLKSDGSDLIPFPMLELQDEVEYLSKRKPNEVFLHNLIFTDTTHIKERTPFLETIIQKHCETIHGDKKELEKRHSTKNDFYYFTLINSMIQLSNYPLELLNKKNKHMCSYVNKHALDNQLFIGNPRTREENIDLLYSTLKGLDEITN